jgi:hypothetical protein
MTRHDHRSAGIGRGERGGQDHAFGSLRYKTEAATLSGHTAEAKRKKFLLPIRLRTLLDRKSLVDKKRHTTAIDFGHGLALVVEIQVIQERTA